MGTTDDRPAVQQLPDQLAERRKRRQPGNARRAPRQPVAQQPPGDHRTPSDDSNQKAPRGWIRGGINGGLGFDEPQVDEVLDKMAAATVSTSPPPAVASEPSSTAELDHTPGASVEVDDDPPAGGPIVDEWLRTYFERQQQQQPSPQTVPRGSAELQAAVAAPKRRRLAKPVPRTRTPARARTTSATDATDRRRPTAVRWTAGVSLIAVVLVLAIAAIGHIANGASSGKSRALGREATVAIVGGWQGADPRSSEHILVIAVDTKVRAAGAAAALAESLERRARPRHRNNNEARASPPRVTTARVTSKPGQADPASTSEQTTPSQRGSTETAPSYTPAPTQEQTTSSQPSSPEIGPAYTPAPAPTPAPTSSKQSSSRPAFGQDGALGPGHSNSG